jgi:exonuclease VII small subunit
LEANKAQFWATMGKSRQKETLDKITAILNAVKPNMRTECSINGSIYQEYISKIDSEISVNNRQEEIDQYVNELQENVVSDITQKWEDLCKTVNNNVSELLQQYNVECSEFTEQTYAIGAVNTNNATITIAPTTKQYFQGIRTQYLNAMFVGGAASIVLQIAGIALGPVGWLTIAAGTLLYGAIFGRQEAKDKAFEKTKQELKNYVRRIIQGAENQLFEVSVFNGKYQSTVDAFVKSMFQFAETSLIEAYNKCEAELKDNEQKIKDTIASTDPNLKTILVNLKTLWNESATKLKAYGEDIKKISNSLFAK